MKNQISERTLELANKAAKIKGVKRMFKPFYYPYKNYLKRKRNKYFQKHALKVLELFDNALKNGGFFYTLAFGTMLGAVREKGFIKHDIDIDVNIWIEDWSQSLRDCLFEHGFELLHNFEIDNGELGREETYVMNDVTIDVFYVYPAIDRYPYCCDFLTYPDVATFQQSMRVHGGLIARRLELPFYKERIQVEFEGLKLYVPKNYDEILRFRYGPDYMIPNPNWTIKSFDNHIVVWNGKTGTVTY